MRDGFGAEREVVVAVPCPAGCFKLSSHVSGLCGWNQMQSQQNFATHIGPKMKKTFSARRVPRKIGLDDEDDALSDAPQTPGISLLLPPPPNRSSDETISAAIDR